MLQDRVRELENMITAAQALREAQVQQVNPAQSGGSRELPRPDVALITIPISAELAGDPPVEVTEYLFVSRLTWIAPLIISNRIRLQVFFRHLYQFNFSLDINKFRLSLAFPSSSPSAPHPALLNAIYLVASLFASPPSDSNSNLEHFQQIFVYRAQRHLDDALAHVDRLLDFLMATTLLGQYNMIKGNVSKGCYLASCKLTLYGDYRFLTIIPLACRCSCYEFRCWVWNAQD